MVPHISQLRDAYKRFGGEFTQEEIFAIVEKCAQDSLSSPDAMVPEGEKISCNLGKIFIDNYQRSNKIYDDDMILFNLGYLFKHTVKGEKVIINNFTSLSKYANGVQDIQGCMDEKQRESYMMNMVKKYFPDRKKDVIINTVEEDEKNASLFSLLAEKGIKGLEQSSLDKQETPSLPQEITSLDIAKYLYRVMEKNSSFKNRISSLMPEKKWVGDDEQKSRILKTEDNYPEYYGMLELACRLNGILTGERFQGGAQRQRRYDKIIKTILGKEGYINKMPELLPLQNFCKEKLGKKEFNVFYIDDREFRNDVWKKERQKEKSKTIKRNTIWALLGTLGMLGLGEVIYDTVTTKNHENNTKNSREILAEVLEDKGIDSSKVYQIVNTMETMESKKIYERIRDFYRTGNTLVKDDIPYEVRIVEAIKNNYHRLQEVTKQVPMDFSEQDSANFVIDKFLMEKFYPSRSYEISMQGGDILPYGKIVDENQEAMDYTQRCPQNITYRRNPTNGFMVPQQDMPEVLGDKREDLLYIENSAFQNLGDWEVNGKKYAIGIMSLSGPKKNAHLKDRRPIGYTFFIASNSTDKLDQRRVFTTGLAKEVLSEITKIRSYANSYIVDPEKK